VSPVCVGFGAAFAGVVAAGAGAVVLVDWLLPDEPGFALLEPEFAVPLAAWPEDVEVAFVAAVDAAGFTNDLKGSRDGPCRWYCEPLVVSAIASFAFAGT
jgi:hypothetical protein